MFSGTVGGKTSKTSVLPCFCKIEHGSGGTSPCYRVLSGFGSRAAPMALNSTQGQDGIAARRDPDANSD